jgi:hypothetical protein
MQGLFSVKAHGKMNAHDKSDRMWLSLILGTIPSSAWNDKGKDQETSATTDGVWQRVPPKHN